MIIIDLRETRITNKMVKYANINGWTKLQSNTFGVLVCNKVGVGGTHIKTLKPDMRKG